MKVKDLLEKMDVLYPFEDAQKWDSIGLMVGSEKTKVDKDKLYVSLDVTLDVLEAIPEKSILVVHHPLIFKPLAKIDYSSYEGKLVYEMIKREITCIVLHTNYDFHFLNRYFVEKILNKKVISQKGHFAYYEEKIVFNDSFKKELKNALGVTRLQMVDSRNKMGKVAVCTGSGLSSMDEAIEEGADLILTGDVTYHNAVKARDMGVSLIDITHFNSEKYFGDDLVENNGFKKVRQQDPYTWL